MNEFYEEVRFGKINYWIVFSGVFQIRRNRI